MATVACSVINESGGEISQELTGRISKAFSERFSKQYPGNNKKVIVKLDDGESTIKVSGIVTYQKGPLKVFFRVSKVSGSEKE
jgi:hypothetical protein